jgi:hypothetical protein
LGAVTARSALGRRKRLPHQEKQNLNTKHKHKTLETKTKSGLVGGLPIPENKNLLGEHLSYWSGNWPFCVWQAETPAPPRKIKNLNKNTRI